MTLPTHIRLRLSDNDIFVPIEIIHIDVIIVEMLLCHINSLTFVAFLMSCVKWC